KPNQGPDFDGNEVPNNNPPFDSKKITGKFNFYEDDYLFALNFIHFTSDEKKITFRISKENKELARKEVFISDKVLVKKLNISFFENNADSIMDEDDGKVYNFHENNTNFSLTP